MINKASLAAVLLMCAVIMGAFGAHLLKDVLSEYAQEVYAKANLYHFIHGLGLLHIAHCDRVGKNTSRIMRASYLFMIVGILLFSGSLYLLALSGRKWLGMITPCGGVCLIVGWGLCALYWSFSSKCNSPSS